MLYLLLPRLGAAPWEDASGTRTGFVVSAECESEARLIAAANCGDESGKAWGSRYSTCEPLLESRARGVVLCRHF